MRLPDIGYIYKTMLWHENNKDHKPNESVGFFIPVPNEIAEQFPTDGKEGEDSSPTHITLLQCGQLPESFEKKIVEVSSKFLENEKPFLVSLKKPSKFFNEEK